MDLWNVYLLMSFAMLVLNIIIIFFSFLGLYLINKKQWNKFARLSFIPILNIYSVLTASWKSFVKFGLYPVLAMIIWIFLTQFTSSVLFLVIACIYNIFNSIYILNWISVRSWYGVWTTILLIFFFPITILFIWIRYKWEIWKDKISTM